MSEVDDDQLAALRRLRAAFGFVEAVEVVGHDQAVSQDPEDDRLGDTGQLGEAHALLVRTVTDPDWHAASQALDDLMGKLLVVQRLLGPRRASPSASREVTVDGP